MSSCNFGYHRRLHKHSIRVSPNKPVWSLSARLSLDYVCNPLDGNNIPSAWSSWSVKFFRRKEMNGGKMNDNQEGNGWNWQWNANYYYWWIVPLCPLYYSLTTDNKDDDNDDDAPVASMCPQMYTINCQQSLCYVFMFVFLNSIILWENWRTQPPIAFLLTIINAMDKEIDMEWVVK